MYGISQAHCRSASQPIDLADRAICRQLSSRQSPAKRQAGMTTMGVIILAVFVGLFAFAALRLTPVYLNYMKVIGVVNGVFDEFDAQNPTRSALRGSIARRFDIESVSVITARDVTVTAVEGGFEVAAIYDHRSPFIANVSFIVHFEKIVIVRR